MKAFEPADSGRGYSLVYTVSIRATEHGLNIAIYTTRRPFMTTEHPSPEPLGCGGKDESQHG